MIVQILLILVIAIQSYFFYIERQKLLDRIQAGNFIDFKKFEDKPKSKPKKEENEIKFKEGDLL